MRDHASLIQAMTGYEAGCPQRVHHFLKVHGFAGTIARLEGLEPGLIFVLEAAAIVHDIGIKPALEKHGRCDGPLQEREGPPLARAMLRGLKYPDDLIERVCWLVGHHHTYTDITGLDYQILVEADFLVNIYEGDLPDSAAAAAYRNIFRTEAGKDLFRQLYGKALSQQDI